MADRFGVEHLKKRIEIELVDYLSIENACKIFKFGNKFNYKRLIDSCLLFIDDSYEEILDTEEFEDLDKEDMLKIVRFSKNQHKSSSKPTPKRAFH